MKEIYNMKQHIKEFRHLIGCEILSLDGRTRYITGVWKKGIMVDYSLVVHITNPYMTSIQFYTEDDELVSYQEYMMIHYHHYYSVWKEWL